MNTYTGQLHPPIRVLLVINRIRPLLSSSSRDTVHINIRSLRLMILRRAARRLPAHVPGMRVCALLRRDSTRVVRGDERIRLGVVPSRVIDDLAGVERDLLRLAVDGVLLLLLVLPGSAILRRTVGSGADTAHVGGVRDVALDHRGRSGPPGGEGVALGGGLVVEKDGRAAEVRRVEGFALG